MYLRCLLMAECWRYCLRINSIQWNCIHPLTIEWRIVHVFCNHTTQQSENFPFHCIWVCVCFFFYFFLSFSFLQFQSLFSFGMKSITVSSTDLRSFFFLCVVQQTKILCFYFGHGFVYQKRNIKPAYNRQCGFNI